MSRYVTVFCLMLLIMKISGCGSSSSTEKKTEIIKVVKKRVAEDDKEEALRRREMEKRRKEEAEKKKAEFERKRALVIHPFGPLSWGDTFYSTINKLMKMPGVEKVALSLGGRKRTPVEKTDDRYLVDKMGALVDNLLPDDRKILPGKTYRDKEGKLRRYPPWEFALFASKANIKGVPFKLRIQFAYSPGIDILKPDDTMSDPALGYSFPLVLRKVVLLSKSSALKSRFSVISSLLAEKYGDYLHFTPSWNKQYEGTCLVIDGHDNRLEIRSGPESYVISYEGQSHLSKFEAVYKKHLAKLEAQAAISNGKDLSDGL